LRSVGSQRQILVGQPTSYADSEGENLFCAEFFSKRRERPKSFDSSLSLQEGGLPQLSQGKNMLARQKSEVGFPTGPTLAGVSRQKKRRHLPGDGRWRCCLNRVVCPGLSPLVIQREVKIQRRESRVSNFLTFAQVFESQPRYCIAERSAIRAQA
jgi:hypothetical protein